MNNKKIWKFLQSSALTTALLASTISNNIYGDNKYTVTGTNYIIDSTSTDTFATTSSSSSADAKFISGDDLKIEHDVDGTYGANANTGPNQPFVVKTIEVTNTSNLTVDTSNQLLDPTPIHIGNITGAGDFSLEINDTGIEHKLTGTDYSGLQKVMFNNSDTPIIQITGDGAKFENTKFVTAIADKGNLIIDAENVIISQDVGSAQSLEFVSIGDTKSSSVIFEKDVIAKAITILQSGSTVVIKGVPGNTLFDTGDLDLILTSTQDKPSSITIGEATTVSFQYNKSISAFDSDQAGGIVEFKSAAPNDTTQFTYSGVGTQNPIQSIKFDSIDNVTQKTDANAIDTYLAKTEHKFDATAASNNLILTNNHIAAANSTIVITGGDVTLGDGASNPGTLDVSATGVHLKVTADHSAVTTGGVTIDGTAVDVTNGANNTKLILASNGTIKDEKSVGYIIDIDDGMNHPTSKVAHLAIMTINSDDVSYVTNQLAVGEPRWEIKVVGGDVYGVYDPGNQQHTGEEFIKILEKKGTPAGTEAVNILTAIDASDSAGAKTWLDTFIRNATPTSALLAAGSGNDRNLQLLDSLAVIDTPNPARSAEILSDTSHGLNNILRRKAGEEICSDHHLWAHGIYGYNDKEAKSTALAGYGNHHYGAVIGYTNRINPDFEIGVAGAYSHSDVKFRNNRPNDKMKINSLSGHVYGHHYIADDMRLKGMISVGHNKFETTTNTIDNTFTDIAAKDKYNLLNFGGEIGIDYAMSWHDFVVIPELSAAFNRVNSKKITQKFVDANGAEKSTNEIALKATNQFYGRAAVTVKGDDISCNMGYVSPYVTTHIGYEHGSFESTNTFQDVAFNSTKPKKGHVIGGVSAGVNMRTHGIMHYGVDVDLTLKDQFFAVSGAIKIGAEF